MLTEAAASFNCAGSLITQNVTRMAYSYENLNLQVVAGLL